MSIVKQRVEKVKKYRMASKREATKKLADFPTQFGENRQPKTDYVLIPRHSSENREYVPFGFFNPNYIVSDSCLCIPSANLYEFGIISSKMHMTWMRYVCGRLKGDYRYSASIVYNNFPFPTNISEKNKNKIINDAQTILDVREKYSDESLANLYDPLSMPPELKKAHLNLDKSVDKTYRSKKFKDDNDRMKLLFNLYLDYTSE